LNAIGINPISIDMGKWAFWGECAFVFPEKIKFTQDYRIASNIRERLIIKEDETTKIRVVANAIRKEVKKDIWTIVKIKTSIRWWR